jgi:GNAT superfamily N-acetyltransferase
MNPRPIHTTNTLGNLSTPYLARDVIELPGSSLPLIRSSCQWAHSILPPDLGAGIIHSLLNKGSSALRPLENWPQSGYELEIYPTLTQRGGVIQVGVIESDHGVTLSSVHIAPNQVVTPLGVLKPSGNASHEAKAWFMDYKYHEHQKNPSPGVDLARLKIELDSVRRTADVLSAVVSRRDQLFQQQREIRSSWETGHYSHAESKLIDEIHHSLPELEQQWLQLDSQFKYFEKRYDLLSQGIPLMRWATETQTVRQLFEDFIDDLYQNDQSSYKKRFSELSPEGLGPDGFDQILFAFHENKVIGMADYSLDNLRTPKTALVNEVVHGQYQKLNVGKMLSRQRDQVLRNEGFIYKACGVYPDNEEQINRLLRDGWKPYESWAADELHHHFWKALDVRYQNVPPTESRSVI